MQISSIMPESSIDYPGKFGPVFFTRGCNYKCGYCYNNLDQHIGNKEIDGALAELETKAKAGWYNGATVCGGEPTMQGGLLDFLERLKKTGVSVKLDTNGSNFPMLGRILEQKLVDYAAMDVKGPFRMYKKIVGLGHIDLRDGLMKGMCAVARFPSYEFRTTMAPVPHEDGELRFLTPAEIKETTEMIEDMTGSSEHNYFLQKFIPVKDKMADSRLNNFSETPEQLLIDAKKLARQVLPRCEIR